MGMFYGKKVWSGETNPQTGRAWVLEDVPAYWRKRTTEWIDRKEGN